jgi:very-short-patch-repair endonuclease
MQRTEEQTVFARKLRRKQTLAERVLWILLRDRDLARYKFRRQQPIGVYFVDFVCMRHKLVIECDGVTHAGRELFDAARDAYMTNRGYRVLRYTDERIHGNPDSVASDILAALQARCPVASAISFEVTLIAHGASNGA